MQRGNQLMSVPAGAEGWDGEMFTQLTCRKCDQRYLIAGRYIKGAQLDRENSVQESFESGSTGCLMAGAMSEAIDCRNRWPNQRMVLIVFDYESIAAKWALDAISSGLLQGAIGVSDLRRGLHSVMCRSAKQVILLTETVLSLSRTVPALSDRHVQELVLLVGGASNAEIARRLCLSPATVKRDVAFCAHLLGAKNRTELAALSSTFGVR